MNELYAMHRSAPNMRDLRPLSNFEVSSDVIDVLRWN